MFTFGNFQKNFQETFQQPSDFFDPQKIQANIQQGMQTMFSPENFKAWSTAWKDAADDAMRNPATMSPLGNPLANPMANPMAGAFSAFGQGAEAQKGGFDWAGMLRAQQKTMESLAAANQSAYVGLQDMWKRQGEMLRMAMESATEASAALMETGSPENKMQKQSEIATRAVEIATAHMREMAELVARAQSDAVDLAGARLKENLAEFTAGLKKSS